MLHDYLTPETYSQLSFQILQDVRELYPDVKQLEHEIEHSSDYMNPHLQIVTWLRDGAIYSNAWQLRQCFPSSFSCFTDQFVWRVYLEIATNIIYEYIYPEKYD